MKPIEDIIVDKIYQLINQVLSQVIKPDIKLKQVTELTAEKILEMKRKYGIEGIILDVDETLRRNMKPIPEINKKWIETAKQQLKIINKRVKLNQIKQKQTIKSKQTIE